MKEADPAIKKLCEVAAQAQFVITTVQNDIDDIVQRRKKFEHSSASTTLISPLERLKTELGDAAARVNAEGVEKKRRLPLADSSDAEVRPSHRHTSNTKLFCVRWKS